VASIVQKEAISPGTARAATAHNAGPVARVIYNRLARGTPLQMDSTVLYALGRDGGPVTPADLAVRTPYNTYLNTGLTPTPICFPSTTALAAALHPPAGKLALLRTDVTRRDGDLLRHLRRTAGGRTTGQEPGASVTVTGPGSPSPSARRSPGWPSAASSLVAVIGDPVRHSLSRCCTTPPSTPSASIGCRWPSPSLPERWPAPWPACGPWASWDCR